MSPPQFHPKEEQNDTGSYDRSPPKINHRPPPSSSAGSSTTPNSQPPRRPVIIYTHSPKVIHTHPRDFMALVQKLTGYTPPPEDTTPAIGDRRHPCGNNNNINNNNNVLEDNESTSVVTEEHGSSVNDNIPQVNSCFVDGGVAVAPPPYRAAGFDPYFNPTTPVFPANPADYLCNTPGQIPFYNPDTLFMNRNSISNSSSSLRVLRDYPDI